LPSRQLVELLGRALLDGELRDRLFEEPEAVAQTFGLSLDETRAIRRLDRCKFEQRVAQLRSA
jgi:hypothetical protein